MPERHPLWSSLQTIGGPHQSGPCYVPSSQRPTLTTPRLSHFPVLDPAEKYLHFPFPDLLICPFTLFTSLESQRPGDRALFLFPCQFPSPRTVSPHGKAGARWMNAWQREVRLCGLEQVPSPPKTERCLSPLGGPEGSSTRSKQRS